MCMACVCMCVSVRLHQQKLVIYVHKNSHVFQLHIAISYAVSLLPRQPHMKNEKYMENLLKGTEISFRTEDVDEYPTC